MASGDIDETLERSPLWCCPADAYLGCHLVWPQEITQDSLRPPEFPRGRRIVSSVVGL